MSSMLMNTRARTYAAVIATIVMAAAAQASRNEFIATFEGKRVAGAEVCFFRPGDGPDPIDLYLRSDEVRCLPADDVIDIPAGRWLYFIKAPGLVSMTPSLIKSAEFKKADLYGSDRTDLTPAGTLNVASLRNQISDGELLGLYVSNQNVDPSFPMLVPIPPAETNVIVPANAPLLVLAIWHGHISRMAGPFVVPVHGQMSAHAFISTPESTSLVAVWSEMAPTARQPGPHWKTLPAPSVNLVSRDKNFAPLIVPGAGVGIDGALLLFSNVPSGKATVRLGGELWQHATMPIEIASPLFVAPTPVITQPASALSVKWSAPTLPVPKSLSSCLAESARPAPPKEAHPLVRLYACEGLQPTIDPSSVDTKACRAIAAPAALNERSKSASFEGVPPGDYLLGIKEPEFPAKRAIVSLRLAERAESVLTINDFRVYGKVTRGGTAVHARLQFINGTAFTDDAGQYEAYLPSSPRNLPIRIFDCLDGHPVYTEIPTAPLRPNEPHDVEIPHNHIQIGVVDKTNALPIHDAAIEVGALIDSQGNGEFLSGGSTTDDKGSTAFDNAPPDRDLIVCATAKTYRRGCSAPFKVGTAESSSVTVELIRAGLQGRILAPAKFAPWSSIFFTAPTGIVTESVKIGEDGTFEYSKTHLAPEHVVIASNFPLFASTLGTEDSKPIEISVPQLPPSQIAVGIGPSRSQADAVIGVWLGPLYVPIDALSLHQDGRRQLSEIYGRGPLVIKDIVSPLGITVALGPRPQDLSSPIDVFTLPDASKYERKAPDAAGRVTF
jgi:hypothetical protein